MQLFIDNHGRNIEHLIKFNKKKLFLFLIRHFELHEQDKMNLIIFIITECIIILARKLSKEATRATSLFSNIDYCIRLPGPQQNEAYITCRERSKPPITSSQHTSHLACYSCASSIPLRVQIAKVRDMFRACQPSSVEHIHYLLHETRHYLYLYLIF